MLLKVSWWRHVSFIRSYFASIFCWFFVDFKSLETLKIVLPWGQEHYFYKIDVFASSPKKPIQNPSKFGFKNPWKFEHHLCQLKVNMLHFWSQKAIKMRSKILENQVRLGQLSSCQFFMVGATSLQPVWKGRGTQRHSRMCPPLNGRPQHLIEAAKRGRLDQMLFFRRRWRHVRRRRPSVRTSSRMFGRPDARPNAPGRTTKRTLTKKIRYDYSKTPFQPFSDRLYYSE